MRRRRPSALNRLTPSRRDNGNYPVPVSGWGAYKQLIPMTMAAILVIIVCEVIRPHALWFVVRNICVEDMLLRKNPFPCTSVDLQGGYAVLRDFAKPTQILLVPTQRLAGIESPTLLNIGSINYWQAAWEARHLIENQIGKPIPREDIAMAINSRYGRTQNQLHIHVDCVRPDVQKALARHQNEIGATWSDLNFHIIHRGFRAMRLEGKDLSTEDPFKRLAYGDSKARADMGRETLAVIGASFSDGNEGFFLLSDRANLTTFDRGLGEELLDPKCRVLTPLV